MSISASMVKELRESTGAGMMDCKSALSETSGNMDEALELLRKKGIAKAAKKASRTAKDGLIGHYIADDGGMGALVEINCETDFVTKTEDFQGFVKKITDLVCEKSPSDMDALMGAECDGSTVKDVQTAVVAKIGENIGIRRFTRWNVESDYKLTNYIHAGSKIGVMVKFADPAGKLDDATARDVAMHVAAMNPQFVSRNDVPESVISKEKEIMLAQIGDTKKPAEIMEKIVTGKIGKFYTEICLEDQAFVKDPDGKSSVGAWLKKIDDGIKLDSFVRLQVGEGVEG